MTRSVPIVLALLLAPAARAQGPAAGANPAVPSVDFDEAVRRAAQFSTSAVFAAQEVRRAEALLEETRSGALPYLSANGTYTRIDHERKQSVLVPAGPLPGPVTGATVRTIPIDATQGSLALSVPLFAPSRWYQWSHASDQLDVARASQADVRRLVTLLAARAYLTIIAQKRLIDVSVRAVENAAAHYDYAHVRRQGGIGNALDEARAAQQLATAQAQLEGALAGLEQAQEALGIATGANAPLDTRGEPDLTGGPASPEEGVHLAEQSRTDVLLAQERAQAAHRVTRDSWADWAPTLGLSAQAYHQSYASATTEANGNGWQAQLVLSFPIWEGGLRTGQLHERQALETESKVQLDGTLEQARSDVRIAYASLLHAAASLDQNRRAADSARFALNLVTQAFQAGATTSLDVTDAERTARDADTSAVVAEDGVRQSRLSLLAAVGRFPPP